MWTFVIYIFFGLLMRLSPHDYLHVQGLPLYLVLHLWDGGYAHISEPSWYHSLLYYEVWSCSLNFDVRVNLRICYVFKSTHICSHLFAIFLVNMLVHFLQCASVIIITLICISSFFLHFSVNSFSHWNRDMTQIKKRTWKKRKRL